MVEVWLGLGLDLEGQERWTGNRYGRMKGGGGGEVLKLYLSNQRYNSDMSL